MDVTETELVAAETDQKTEDVRDGHFDLDQKG